MCDVLWRTRPLPSNNSCRGSLYLPVFTTKETNLVLAHVYHRLPFISLSLHIAFTTTHHLFDPLHGGANFFFSPFVTAWFSGPSHGAASHLTDEDLSLPAGAVEACLSHGLKRRTLGLFKTSSTTALIHKVGKCYEPASTVSKIVQDMDSTDTARWVEVPLFSLRGRLVMG